MDLAFITDPIVKFLNERVFGHLPSSIAGWLAGVLLESGTYWDSQQAVAVIPEKYRFVVHVLTLIAIGWGSSYKKAAASSGTGTPPQAGFITVRLGLFVALAVFATMLAIPARAQTPSPSPARPSLMQPKFGGCLASGQTCFGPSVSISLVSIDLKSGSVTTGVMPGVGYGAIFFADQWYRAGVAGYTSFRDTADGQRMVGSLVFSFAEYLRLGVGRQFGPSERFFGLLGIGSEFGSVPTARP